MTDPLRGFDNLSGPPDAPPDPPPLPLELQAAGTAQAAARDAWRYASAMAYFNAAYQSLVARISGKSSDGALRLPFIDFRFANGDKPDKFTIDMAQLDEEDLEILEPVFSMLCVLVKHESDKAWDRIIEAYNARHNS
jgi:hypothetical protein